MAVAQRAMMAREWGLLAYLCVVGGVQGAAALDPGRLKGWARRCYPVGERSGDRRHAAEEP